MGSTEKSGLAPWESVPLDDQLWVVITGANSGSGLGTCQRLIDEFLATRSLTSHLILLPTTRSASKCTETIRSLRTYALTAASSPQIASRAAAAGLSIDDTLGRIHVLSLSMDLCDLRGLCELASKMCYGTVSNPYGLEGEQLRDVKIPKLDSVICNAAYGGWSGVNYLLAVWCMLTQGLVEAVSWPIFKNALPTRILNEQSQYDYPPKPLLGEVFSACVFGHYLFAHHLLPLLYRPSPSSEPGRIIWCSSVEATEEVFKVDDIQCFNASHPYDSAKRLMDFVSLTSTLPSAAPLAEAYLTPDDPEVIRAKPVAPRMYLSHPGIMASLLFPLPWYLFWAYRLALVLARWMGSAWHTVDGYPGAKSAVWLTLEPQAALDAQGEHGAERIKWGSSTDRHLVTRVKMTEVEGWGWEGKVEDANAEEEGVTGVLRKAVSRKQNVVDATEESIVRFEEIGAECWKQMEDMRATWTKILDLHPKKH